MQLDIDNGRPVRIVIFIDTNNVVSMIIPGADADDESWYSRDADSYAQAVEHALEGMFTMRKLYPAIVFIQRTCPETKSLEEELGSV